MGTQKMQRKAELEKELEMILHPPKIQEVSVEEVTLESENGALEQEKEPGKYPDGAKEAPLADCPNGFEAVPQKKKGKAKDEPVPEMENGQDEFEMVTNKRKNGKGQQEGQKPPKTSSTNGLEIADAKKKQNNSDESRVAKKNLFSLPDESDDEDDKEESLSKPVE